MTEANVLLIDLMVENVISLNPESTMKQAADAFIPYGFRALPSRIKTTLFWGLFPIEMS
jgi:hypothetical protein